ncbi:hypothetical protein U9M48_011546 [Paspalum notatum var. saurae]|uniref:Uncharacterized protein n=1 Tax=Paspalum notatum var. saurae TaxID=547442 RepID=A0AAQ3SW20_PASNO
MFDFLASKSSGLMDHLAVLPLVFFELAKQGSPAAIDLAQDGFPLISLAASCRSSDSSASLMPTRLSTSSSSSSASASSSSPAGDAPPSRLIASPGPASRRGGGTPAAAAQADILERRSEARASTRPISSPSMSAAAATKP